MPCCIVYVIMSRTEPLCASLVFLAVSWAEVFLLPIVQPKQNKIIKTQSSLPRSRFLDVTQRSSKETRAVISQFGERNVVPMSAAVSLGERCVTSKKLLRGRLDSKLWRIKKILHSFYIPKLIIGKRFILFWALQIPWLFPWLFQVFHDLKLSCRFRKFSKLSLF